MHQECVGLAQMSVLQQFSLLSRNSTLIYVVRQQSDMRMQSAASLRICSLNAALLTAADNPQVSARWTGEWLPAAGKAYRKQSSIRAPQKIPLLSTCLGKNLQMSRAILLCCRTALYV